MASSQTIVLITGANQGIGYETAKNLLLSSSSYRILLGSRDIVKGLSAVESLEKLGIRGSVEPLQLDVTDDSSVDAAAKHVEGTYGRIDVLVNNAGIGSQRGNGVGARDAMRAVLAVNLVGVVSVTEAFLPLLRTSTSRDRRVIFVSSTTGSITYAADPAHTLHGAGAMDYRSSKAALSMVMVQYHVLLKNEGVKVHGVNPGLIATTGFHSGRKVGSEPEVGGERVARVIRGERDGDVGQVVTGDADGVLPW